jgi:hypothetical protein
LNGAEERGCHAQSVEDERPRKGEECEGPVGNRDERGICKREELVRLFRVEILLGSRLTIPIIEQGPITARHDPACTIKGRKISAESSP